jgi:hypothetical protein
MHKVKRNWIEDIPGDARQRDQCDSDCAGVFGQSDDQIPSVHAGFFGNDGPVYANNGGFDPVLFATKWQWSVQQNVTKVWGNHTLKAGVSLTRKRMYKPRKSENTISS